MAELIRLNPEAVSWTWRGSRRSRGTLQASGPAKPPARVLDFHKILPDYDKTQLHTLPTLADELGLSNVLLKDESSRFGLPSFKILGASWAVFRAVADKLDIAISSDGPSLESLGAEARAQGLVLVTSTEGNWGRAVARMAKYLGIPARILVPSFMPDTTRERIRSEGADVVVVEGNYDDSVSVARQAAETEGLLLVMDFGWEGYEVVPEWVVEGYSTMLNESDEQVLLRAGMKSVTHAFVPVGVGSIAQAVTQHFKDSERATGQARVISVEPTTAASLKTSLESGAISTIPTDDTIMCGMNCGTVSTTAWPVLKAGLDASVIVTDAEADNAVQDLKAMGVNAGPCGASTLAALRRTVAEKRDELGLNRTASVILFCTEGPREYEMSHLTIQSSTGTEARKSDLLFISVAVV